jgi:hypothetical protein
MNEREKEVKQQMKKVFNVVSRVSFISHARHEQKKIMSLIDLDQAREAIRATCERTMKRSELLLDIKDDVCPSTGKLPSGGRAVRFAQADTFDSQEQLLAGINDAYLLELEDMMSQLIKTHTEHSQKRHTASHPTVSIEQVGAREFEYRVQFWIDC